MPDNTTGFARNFEPEKIIGEVTNNGILFYRIKWRNCKDIDIVPAVEAQIGCPQLIIEYEKRIKIARPASNLNKKVASQQIENKSELRLKRLKQKEALLVKKIIPKRFKQQAELMKKRRSNSINEPEHSRLYIVERILGRRKRSGLIEYFVKWEGLSSSENTWEPECNLATCPQKIDEFERKWMKKHRSGVEKIVNKRIRRGLLEYFVKWKGYPSSENTWEPISFLHCSSEAITEFEQKQALELMTKDSSNDQPIEVKPEPVELENKASSNNEPRTSIKLSDNATDGIKDDSSDQSKLLPETSFDSTQSFSYDSNSKLALKKKVNRLFGRARNSQDVDLDDFLDQDSSNETEESGFSRDLKPEEIVEMWLKTIMLVVYG